MAESSSFLHKLDSQLDSLFASWNVYTTALFIVLTVYFAYPLFFANEPDIHPLLLARQASASPVRQPGESAIYRSQEVPHGYPLRTGLDVKDEDTPKWHPGRNGDLRDVWRQAAKEQKPTDAESTPQPSKIHAIMGKETTEVEVESMTKEIAILGAHLKQHQVGRVAILLPNSVELLVSFFASTFFNITVILIPQDASPEAACSILRRSKADTLIASAGALPLDSLKDFKVDLKQLIWVAEPNSRHMDWHEVHSGVGGKTDIAVWHEILEESTATDLPNQKISDVDLAKVIFATSSSNNGLDKTYNLIEFEQQSIVAAIAAQRSAIPSSQRLGSSDVFLSLVPFTDQHALIMLLTALYLNASIALTSSSGPTVDYTTAFRGHIQPTVILASPQTLTLHLTNDAKTPHSKLRSFRDFQISRALAEGQFPTFSPLAGSPRLIYTTQGMDQSTSLTAKQLSDFRILTHARIINALSDPKVAGAIAQTHVFDYRVREVTSEDGSSAASHFGPPVSCVEVKLLDEEEERRGGKRLAGRLVVEGPAVVGGGGRDSGYGRAELGRVAMTMTDSNTLAYASKWLMR